MILLLLSWLLFGLVVGYLAKMLHPGDDPVGFAPTVGIGVVGSFIGGAFNWLLGLGNQPFQASGLIMSILGGVVFCALYRYYKLKTSPTGPKGFFSGKSLK
jgi:uncharacterized membrane protein YeaQ/YmgE (transglycosylase-associated protein family)